jgi:GGDEF domain-containing protein
MPETKINKQKLFHVGRFFLMLFNRSMMYDANHPYCQHAIDQLLPALLPILVTRSPVVFTMNQEQIFVDEEPVDQRVNTSKMVAFFKKTEIQSISLYNGIDRDELVSFTEIFTSLKRYPNANAMKKEMEVRRIKHVRINHVFFKKVSRDEEVVSRKDYKKIKAEGEEDGSAPSKKMFMDMVLESIIAEEFGKSLTIKNLVDHPVEISNQMIDADLRSFQQSDAVDRSHGPVLAHQLNIIEAEVDNNLSGLGDADLSSLAEAVFEMKRQLIKGIELQKSTGTAYSNEEALLDKANEIADRVVLKLIKDEYKSGKISTSRLAQILKRLVPEPGELKRLLPKIKNALLEEGMQLADYLKMVDELSNELQDEELSKILQQSAEAVGLYGQDLIMEVKNNPVQAAELIFLAAEIRKAGGDENMLTDLLVDYVEKIGSKLTLDTARENKVDGEQHLRQVMDSVESEILARLRKMDVREEILKRIEERLNSRYEETFDNIKGKWNRSLAPQADGKEDEPETSVLKILEQSVGENNEFANILKMVRDEVHAKGIGENDFKTILEEITKQYESWQRSKDKTLTFQETLDSKGLAFFLDKEISRASRYDLPFAAVSFAVVSAKAKRKFPKGSITQAAILEAVMERFASNIRGSDIAAMAGKNRIVGIFPMTTPEEAKLAFKRHLKFINTRPFDINGVSVAVQVAGSVANFDGKRTPNTSIFLQVLFDDLSVMVNRIKNIHGLA